MFHDVPAEAWYARAVEVAAALGLIAGYPDGTFRPEEPVTRAQLAAIASRLANNDLVLRRWASLRLRSQVAPAVVHIEAGGAVGAGVIVHPAGFVVTCHHVVAGAPRLDCRFPGWEGHETDWPDLKLVAEAPEVDLALCRISWPAMAKSQGFPWMRLATSPAEPGEPVVMLGSPVGISGWESHGLVARREIVAHIYQLPQKVVCMSGPVNPGNSGGALVRASDGTLLGIVNAKLVHEAIECMAFAVPAPEVAGLLDRVGVRQP